jgi:RNA polymerase sigma factor (sigma-70 family)
MTLTLENPLDTTLNETDTTIVTTGLNAYLKDIPTTRLLTANEEIRLAHQRDQGDPRAVHRLVEHNLRLVVFNVKGYHNQTKHPMLDLIQEGNIGLMRAAEKFDPTYKTRFTTYATPWIHQGIRRYLATQTRTIRLPEHVDAKLRLIKRETTRLESELGRTPSVRELSIATSLEETIVEETIAFNYSVGTFDNDSTSDDSGSAWVNRIADDQPPVSDIFETNEQAQQIKTTVETLDEETRLVVTLRYGLDNTPALSLKQISKRLDLTPLRVRQIENYALQTLRLATNTKTTNSTTH